MVNNMDIANLIDKVMAKHLPLDENEEATLSAALADYPFFQALHALRFNSKLLAQGGNIENDTSDAIYIPDRKRSYLWSISTAKDESCQTEMPSSRTVDLIDSFLNKTEPSIPGEQAPENKKDDEPTSKAQSRKSERERNESNAGDYSLDEDNVDDACFTETLAKIYVKQGRYAKALEIIKKLSLKYPQKNAYFASQTRMIEELINNPKNETN